MDVRFGTSLTFPHGIYGLRIKTPSIAIQVYRTSWLRYASRLSLVMVPSFGASYELQQCSSSGAVMIGQDTETTRSSL